MTTLLTGPGDNPLELTTREWHAILLRNRAKDAALVEVCEAEIRNVIARYNTHGDEFNLGTIAVLNVVADDIGK